MESILTVLRNAYPGLSPSKKKVVSYFLNHYSTLHMDTVTELAEKIGVSDTTIINLCSELGFLGYSGFRRSAKEEILLASGGRKWEKLQENDRSAGIRAFSAETVDSVTKTLEDPEIMESIIKAADLLGKSGMIYTVGFWSYSAVAKVGALKLMYRGYRSEAIYPDMGDYIDHLLWTEEGSVAIVYDYSLYVTALTEVCSILKERNIRIILITDTGPCPRISMADVVIHCKSGVESLGMIVTDAIMENLITAYPRSKPEYSTRLREGVFTRFNPYGVIEPSGGNVPRI